MNRTIVISAIALRSGGTLSILQDCLQELARPEYQAFTIVVLVKEARLMGISSSRFQVIELDGTGSYFRRCYYEYVYFKKLSKQLKPDLWFSLHDMSPNVVAERRAVYCHNATPFYTVSWKELAADPKFGLFTWLYGLLYRINIRKNSWVVVQQQCLRQAFATKFNLPESKIIVAYPSSNTKQKTPPATFSSTPVFFYPLLPRVFKNVDVIGDAVKILNQRGYDQFSVILTLDGNENRYAQKLYSKYSSLKAIRWIGQISREEVFRIYGTSDYLIFPSRLESWGLPISEFKQTGKPILLADLPYAHETGGRYEGLIFFDPSNAGELADCMEDRINGKSIRQQNMPVAIPHAPMAEDWAGLFKIMLTF